jgi:predicted permease
MWMVRPHPIATGWLCAAAYMLVKLVLLPALMVGCCFAVGLRGATARAAVLVATLPISGAAFVLSKTYGVGEDVAATNVFLGNLLVLPTTISWLEFMDAVNLFPSSKPTTAPMAACV